MKEDISKRRFISLGSEKFLPKERSKSAEPMVRTWSRYTGAVPGTNGLAGCAKQLGLNYAVAVWGAPLLGSQTRSAR